jgi:hypothetical protein
MSTDREKGKAVEARSDLLAIVRRLKIHASRKGFPEIQSAVQLWSVCSDP